LEAVGRHHRYRPENEYLRRIAALAVKNAAVTFVIAIPQTSAIAV
jgi:hypothetical protein